MSGDDHNEAELGRDAQMNGEAEFVAWLRHALPGGPPGQRWVGDDAAVLDDGLLLATDVLVANVHFDLNWCSGAPDELVHRRVDVAGADRVDPDPAAARARRNDTVKHAFELGHATGLQDPDEIAEIVVFLASEASRSLTGAVLNCDRGWTAFKQPDLLRDF